MRRLDLIIVIHNHQPVGNFDFVFERACEQAYEPFLDIFARHPSARMCLHLSGPLYDWLVRNRRTYIDRVAEQVRRGRIEIVGGGLSEPILAVLPVQDAIDQVAMFRDRLEQDFGTPVRGAWLTERVWEPHLPHVLTQAGIEYIPLDDFHFIRSGIPASRHDSFFYTECDNRPLAVYPGSKRLRYIMPFAPVTEVAQYLRSAYDSGMRTIVFADDGEKFGIWPETHQWVYGQHWLDEFLSFIDDNSDWINMTTLRNHFGTAASNGVCYFPTTSYPELGEWALPTDAAARYKAVHDDLLSRNEFDGIEPFFQGGQWRNFLAKYPESQFMHKKMLFLSELLREQPRERKADLFRSQCNDAYWHGVFGGLYLPHLRREIHSAIIAGLSDALPGTVAERYDFDVDGEPELYAATGRLAAVFDPGDGGTVISIDHQLKRVNMTDTLARRPEPYHARIAEASAADGTTKTIHDRFVTKEDGLEALLVYDQYRKTGMRIHFLPDDAHERLLSHTAIVPHAVSTAPCTMRFDRTGEDVTVILDSNGSGWSCTRSCCLAGPVMTMRFEGVCPSFTRYLGVEWNFNLFAPDAPDRHVTLGSGPKMPLRTRTSADDISAIRIADEWLGVAATLSAHRTVSVIVHPIETVTLSEAGVERTFQGTSLFLLFPVTAGRFDEQMSLALEDS